MRISNIICSMETPRVTSVELYDHEKSVYQYGSGYLGVIILPYNAANKTVTFQSSDTSVATVDEYGEVTGWSPGTATITVTTDDGGFIDTCVVTVIPYVFTIRAKDKWTGLLLSSENVYEGNVSGGMTVYNAEGEGFAGGSFVSNGYIGLNGAPEEYIGSPPYTYEFVAGRLIESKSGTLNKGFNEIFFDCWSVQTFRIFAGDEYLQGDVEIDMQDDNIFGEPLIYTGDSSYCAFEYIKAGRYRVKITHIASETVKYVEIIVPLMQPYLEPLVIDIGTALSQVKQPVWSKKIVTWKDVANAESYTVRLYNASAECLDTQTVAKGIQRYDYTDLIENYLPAGSYTATVQAMPERVT